MSDLATLSALKARVEAATGPDRGLDREIHAGLGLPSHAVVHRDLLWNLYTSSVDAALSLLKRMLPGWEIDIHISGGGYAGADVRGPEFNDADMSQYAQGELLKGAPLAILSALLTAKIAQLEAPHAR